MKYKNKIKNKTYNEINGILKKYNKQDFDTAWKNIMKMTRQIYGFKRNKDLMGNKLTNKKFSEITANFIKEYAYHSDNTYELFLNSKGETIKERFIDATYNNYKSRLGLTKYSNESFIQKYGNIIVGTGYDKTINEYLEMLKDNLITSDELNKIIETFKETNRNYENKSKEYYEQEHYKEMF